MTEIDQHDVRTLSLAIRSRKLKPSEIVDFHLSRIDAWNEKIFALRSVGIEQARKAARQADQDVDTGKPLGRLHGIPFCVKDHINVAGLARSEGTKLDSEEVCSSNARAVQRFIDEGAICIGKSNMSQYGKSYATENVDFGRTSNPFDLEFSPGGSSGGDAAAVSSGMAQFAIGADSGGSVRVPASFCGLFGLSPTPGRISNAGLSEFSHSLRTIFRNIGIFAKSIHDLELLAQVACGFDPLDPYSAPLPHSLALESVKFARNDLNEKFVWFDDIAGTRSSEEISATLSTAVKAFESLNFHGLQKTPDFIPDCMVPFIILGVQAGLMSEDIAAEVRGTPRDFSKESPGLQTLRLRLKEELPELSAQAILRYWYEIDRLRYQAAAFFEDFDFILCPVSATPAYKHGTTEYEVRGNKLPNQEVFRFSNLPNVLGLPAVAFPTGLNQEGLPLGLQIIGPRFSERRLIQLVREAGFVQALRPQI